MTIPSFAPVAGTLLAVSTLSTAGLPILSGDQTALTIGANTTLSAVTLAGVSQLNLTVGN